MSSSKMVSLFSFSSYLKSKLDWLLPCPPQGLCILCTRFVGTSDRSLSNSNHRIILTMNMLHLFLSLFVVRSLQTPSL